MSDASPGQYWFNTRSGEVDVGHQKPGAHLMGPYRTRAEAERALQTARERTEAWDRAEAAEAEDA